MKQQRSTEQGTARCPLLLQHSVYGKTCMGCLRAETTQGVKQSLERSSLACPHPAENHSWLSSFSPHPCARLYGSKWLRVSKTHCMLAFVAANERKASTRRYRDEKCLTFLKAARARTLVICLLIFSCYDAVQLAYFS